MNVIVVGIAGGSGSGKSSLVNRLRQSDLSDSIATIAHDHYYHSPETVSDEIRETGNWDHPDAIDNGLFLRHLDALREGHSIESPEYCFLQHRRKSSTIRITPKPILIVEGILLFAISEICERIDWRIFVEAPADERVLRRLLRDTRERGRSVQSVIDQYRNTAQPMHDMWIEPSRNRAHLILPNVNHASIDYGCEMIHGFLAHKLRK